MAANIPTKKSLMLVLDIWSQMNSPTPYLHATDVYIALTDLWKQNGCHLLFPDQSNICVVDRNSN
jgi:hypothetical protein